MNKYLETTLKAAKKAGLDHMSEIILYKNYMVATDGQRLHAMATGEHYGEEARFLTSKHNAPNVGALWDESDPTHTLTLDSKAIKRLKKLVEAIELDTAKGNNKQKQGPLLVEFVNNKVHFSNKESNNFTFTFAVNGHPEQDGMRFLVNGFYLLDLLAEEASWKLAQPKGEGSPIWFESGDKKACIMPMREE